MRACRCLQVSGEASFTDASATVAVRASTGGVLSLLELRPKHGVVLATGARPVVPLDAIVGLRDTPFVT